METESKLGLADVFVSITEPRQARKVKRKGGIKARRGLIASTSDLYRAQLLGLA